MKVAFYKRKHGNMQDYLIDAASGFGGYSHCELVFDGNANDYDYSKSYCFSISGRDNCARYKVIDLTSGHWDIFQVSDNIVESFVLKESSKFLNTKYDYLGIICTWIVPIGYQDEKKWWCSELCSNLLGIEQCRISPNRFSKAKFLKKF